eukprot:g49175.t1
MSSLDYVALGNGLSPPPLSGIHPLRTVAALLSVLAVMWGSARSKALESWLSMPTALRFGQHKGEIPQLHTEVDSSSESRPSKSPPILQDKQHSHSLGSNGQLAGFRSGPATPAFGHPTNEEEVLCIFSYGTASKEFGRGAEIHEAWLYGAKRDRGALAYPTGSAEDILAGRVYCFPPALVPAKLFYADEIIQSLKRPADSPSPRREVVKVMKTDGTSVSAYWYFQFYFPTRDLSEAMPPVSIHRFAKQLGFTPSTFQKSIFQHVLSPHSRNLMVEAGPGCAKTTTAVEVAKLVQGSVVFLVFNRASAEVLKQRISGNVEARTFHSLCRGPVLGDQRITADKLWRLQKVLMTAQEMHQYGEFSRTLVSLAKNAGFELFEPANTKSFEALISYHALAKGIFGSQKNRDRGIYWAQELLKLSNTSPLVDFDDLLYFAVRDRVDLPKYDWVFIDEAQDTNAIQRAILHQVMHPGSRLVAIGDPKQAIYGFRGSDRESFQQMSKEFNCTTLPLSVSYRCSEAIVDFARRWVPELQPAPNAAKGEVVSLSHKDWHSTDFSARDMVLCRYNAPLFSMAFEMLGEGLPVRMIGQDLNQELMSLVQSSRGENEDHNLDLVVQNLATWERRETETRKNKTYEEMEQNARPDPSDMVKCIKKTISALSQTQKTVSALLALLENNKGKESEGPTLSTIHQAKGAESDVVWWLGHNLCPNKPKGWQRQEEENLMYVAVTRAKRKLVLAELDEEKWGYLARTGMGQGAVPRSVVQQSAADQRVKTLDGVTNAPSPMPTEPARVDWWTKALDTWTSTGNHTKHIQLLNILFTWRQDIAQRLEKDAEDVMSEDDLKRLVYVQPERVECLQPSSLHDWDLQALVDIIVRWKQDHGYYVPIMPGYDACVLALPDGDVRPPKTWQTYKILRSGKPASWEESYKRFQDGESAVRIAMRPAQFSKSQPMPLRESTVVAHIFKAFGYGKPVALRRLAQTSGWRSSVLPDKKSWDLLEAAAQKTRTDVLQEKLNRTELLAPILSAEKLLYRFASQEEAKEAKINIQRWYTCLTWFIWLKRAGLTPSFPADTILQNDHRDQAFPAHKETEELGPPAKQETKAISTRVKQEVTGPGVDKENCTQKGTNRQAILQVAEGSTEGSAERGVESTRQTKEEAQVVEKNKKERHEENMVEEGLDLSQERRKKKPTQKGRKKKKPR